MGTVVDVIINQGATHKRCTYIARGRNLYKLIKDQKKPAVPIGPLDCRMFLTEVRRL